MGCSQDTSHVHGKVKLPIQHTAIQNPPCVTSEGILLEVPPGQIQAAPDNDYHNLNNLSSHSVVVQEWYEQVIQTIVSHQIPVQGGILGAPQANCPQPHMMTDTTSRCCLIQFCCAAVL